MGSQPDLVSGDNKYVGLLSGAIGGGDGSGIRRQRCQHYDGRLGLHGNRVLVAQRKWRTRRAVTLQREVRVGICPAELGTRIERHFGVEL